MKFYLLDKDHKVIETPFEEWVKSYTKCRDENHLYTDIDENNKVSTVFLGVGNNAESQFETYVISSIEEYHGYEEKNNTFIGAQKTHANWISILEKRLKRKTLKLNFKF